MTLSCICGCGNCQAGNHSACGSKACKTSF